MANEKYTSRVHKIEGAIASALPERVDSAWMSRVAGDLLEGVPSTTIDIIMRPVRELLIRGGKRWRPLVCLLSCELYGDGARALPLSVVVELAHNGTLVVDDIEDRSEYRRGGSSVHLLFGEDVAINAGNMLYFLPTYLIDSGPYSDPEKSALYRMYTEDMRRLHFGQGLDIQWHAEHAHRPTRGEYLQMCRLKTGSLARMAARMGVFVGGGGGERADRFGRVWEEIGVAFQIIDDVKNLTTGIPGKHRGDDIVEGKKSLPVIIASEKGGAISARLDNCFRDAKSGGPSSPAVEEAISIMESSGGIREAEGEATQMIGRAKAEILENCPDGEAKGLLLELLSGFSD
ncbi:MAG TPA: polyprenyl synthetase family protein [Spirochaetia bacterium]|nr:polyprenyl synthetase family protein [Spirochaetia bacterium]